MSNRWKKHFIVLVYFFSFTAVKGQTINRVSANDGIWEDYGPVVSAITYPEFHGRLVNVNWSDIEIDPSEAGNWKSDGTILQILGKSEKRITKFKTSTLWNPSETQRWSV